MMSRRPPSAAAGPESKLDAETRAGEASRLEDGDGLLRDGAHVVLSERATQAEADLARFFDQSLDLLCVVDRDGYLTRLNPAWTTGLGWTLEELKATPLLDFVHPADRELTRDAGGRVAAGQAAIRFEHRYRHRDGSYRWLEWQARQVPDRDDIYATARDITRRKHLERELLEIVDREQERLGRELHDGLCQTLAGIAALSATLSRRVARTDATAAVGATEITSLLNAAIREARDLARGLGPIGLPQAGLVATLDALARSVRHRFGVACAFVCDDAVPRLGHEMELHLFRIAQQAAHNAVTHGHATQIDIRLHVTDGNGRLRVEDDGVGIAEAVTGDGTGLQTMAYRARLIGASLEVRRRARRGTATTCTFPVRLTAAPPLEDPDHDDDTR